MAVKAKTDKQKLSKHVALLRIVFGLMWAIDASFKWTPYFRDSFLGSIKTAAQGQADWFNPWFNFWTKLLGHNPHLFAILTALFETLLAIALIFGIARRTAYLAGAVFSFLIWAIAEGFGGPYTSQSTDIGTGIIYTVVLLSLYGLDKMATPPSWSLDNYLIKRIPWWAVVSSPK